MKDQHAQLLAKLPEEEQMVRDTCCMLQSCVCVACAACDSMRQGVGGGCLPVAGQAARGGAGGAGMMRMLQCWLYTRVRHTSGRMKGRQVDPDVCPPNSHVPWPGQAACTYLRSPMTQASPHRLLQTLPASARTCSKQCRLLPVAFGPQVLEFRDICSYAVMGGMGAQAKFNMFLGKLDPFDWDYSFLNPVKFGRMARDKTAALRRSLGCVWGRRG